MQNQGFSKVVVVYSEVMVKSQRINLAKPNARQENGQQSRVGIINQSKYKKGTGKSQGLTKGVY